MPCVIRKLLIGQIELNYNNKKSTSSGGTVVHHATKIFPGYTIIGWGCSAISSTEGAGATAAGTVSAAGAGAGAVAES